MPQISVKIGAYSLALYPLLMIGVAVLMLGFVYLLMTRSVYGMKARASIQVPEMARAIGISSARVNTMTFALGCGLAGFAGAVLLPIVPATPSMGFAFVIKAFLTVVVAGPVTLTGSALAAIGLGGGASVTASFLTSVAGDAFFFIVTALLLWRYPLGISAVGGASCEAADMTLSQRLYRASAWLFPALAVAVAIFLSFVIDPYLAFLGASWVIFGLLGLSLDIVWGRGGFLSLGQTAFFGLGGYVGAIAAVNLGPLIGNTLLPTLPIAALFGGLCAGVLGSLIFFARMGPLQATILSYTFTLLLWSVTQSLKFTVGEAVVGGDNGMSGIPGMVIGFGPDARALAPNGVFAVCVIVAALAYFATLGLMRSTFGRVVDCIRLDIQKTELLGYDVRRVQVANMAWAGAVAGLAGGLFALWSNYLNPSLFSVQEALLPPIHVLVGGLGTLAGPFVGALTIGGLSFWLGGGAAGGQTTLILGVVLVLLVLFLRNGILGALDQVWRRFLPDPNAAARDAGEVRINVDDLEWIMREAEAQVGPAKPMATDQAFKQFGGVIPVNKVSRNFQPGRPMALIGPNGAGKSSYLKTCVGVYQPEGGHITIGDTDVTHAPIFRRVRLGMGVKNQKPQVFGALSVHDNLWTAAFARTRDKRQADDVAGRILAMLGMIAQSDVEAQALSHGQQQWLDIGMVLYLAPRVVLLDEPAAGMTNEETRELSLLVRTLARHTTVVVVEHDMEFVRTLEGHVTVLHQGEVFAEGDIDCLRADERVLDIYLGRRQHV